MLLKYLEYIMEIFKHVSLLQNYLICFLLDCRTVHKNNVNSRKEKPFEVSVL